MTAKVELQNSVDECLPTLYNYFTGDGISNGLSDKESCFKLNNKDIVILSGAIHYFRVPRPYWKDRLRKLRAAGFNTVETYVPWNLHEPEEGCFDFGNGGSDYEDLLDINHFLELAKEEDLFALVRPGPYICAEWEFGGLPSWLLKDDSVKVRTSNEKFVKYFQNYFKRLLNILVPLQFTRGGPIIAFQIENEYGNTKHSDPEYLQKIKESFEMNGIVELLFTSDTPSAGFSGTLPGILATANFDVSYDIEKELSLLKQHQPDKPLMVMEYWTGWFDHWWENHQSRDCKTVCKGYEKILSLGSSINTYMFHGGSNWGFLNGGNFLNDLTDNSGYIPTTSSYDYDAPLAENGDYTEKYFKLKEINEKYSTIKIQSPILPELTERIIYSKIKITGQLRLQDFRPMLPHCIESQDPLPMEKLPINHKNGQSYGYIIYRKENVIIPANAKLTIEGHVCDSVLVMINGELQNEIPKDINCLSGFGYWKSEDSSLLLGPQIHDEATIELIVENCGRANFGKLEQFNQHKGLWQGNILLNGEVLENWKIYPVEFISAWTNSLKQWNTPTFTTGPALYKAILEVSEVRDTYIDMRKWCKGIVIVNGFVLSRYMNLGPQQAIYLPAPFIKLGMNDLIVFEHFIPSKEITFAKNQIYHSVK